MITPSNLHSTAMDTPTSNASMSRNPPPPRASTPVQQQQAPHTTVSPTTPQRQIQPALFVNSMTTPRHGHFNPFLRSNSTSSSSSNVVVPPPINTLSNLASNNTTTTAFNRPLRHSSLHQVTMPQTPESSPVSPMSFDTPGGVHTPTMNAPIHGAYTRDSQTSISSIGGGGSFYNGSAGIVSSTASTASTAAASAAGRYNSGWPLSRTRSHDSPTAGFNYGPSSSVSSLGLESGFMLDRNSERSSSEDEYAGDYDSDDLMSMGSRRQSLSTPHFLPIFRSDTNNGGSGSGNGGSKVQRIENGPPDTCTQNDSQEARHDRYRRMSTTSESESGHHSNSDGSALKSFFSTFRPDTKRSLLGSSSKKSPMSSFFGSTSSSSRREGEQQQQQDVGNSNSNGNGSNRFGSKRFSSIITTKNHENKTKRNEKRDEALKSSSSVDIDIDVDGSAKSSLSNSPEISHADERTTIRRFVSEGRSLRPKVKSFLRITRDLQDEMSPLDSEIKQEARITNALRDDGGSPKTSSASYSFNNYNPQYHHRPFAASVPASASAPNTNTSSSQQHAEVHGTNTGSGKLLTDSLHTSFAPIPTASSSNSNSQRQRPILRSESTKSINSSGSSNINITTSNATTTSNTNSNTNTNTTTNTTIPTATASNAKLFTAPIVTTPIHSVKRKASIMEDNEPAFLKRRAVSPGYVSPVVGSPTSGSLGSKRNIKHLRDTSDGFEKMSLA